MRKLILLFKLALSILASSLVLFSCTDKDIDMDNVSDNMRIGNSVAAPLGEADFNIEKLLANFKSNDSAFSIGSQNNVVTLFYKDTIEYENPTNLTIGSSQCMSQLITGSDFTNPIIGTQNININTTYNANKEFHITKIADDAEAKIDSIYFYYSNVKLNLTTDATLNGGSIEIKIKLKDASTGLYTKELIVSTNEANKVVPLENFEISTTSKDSSYLVPMDITFKPASGQSIVVNSSNKIEVKFEPLDITKVNGIANSKFVAFGQFKYSDKFQPLTEKVFDKLKLYDFLPPGCLIKPVDPQITLNVTNNIGVPLNINIDSLQTSDGMITKKATFTNNGNQIKVKRADTNGTNASTEIIFSKDADKGNIDDLFAIKLQQALLDINFTRDSVTPETTKQFIRSDSKIKVDVTMALPIWLESNSVLAYNDTIKLDMADLLNSDAVTNAVIKLSNTNRLPLGVKITFKLMDENYAIIPTANQYIYNVDPANVDGEGNVTSEVKSAFDIHYNQTSIADLKKAKHILLDVKCLGFNNGASKIRIKNQDGLKIKIGVYTQAGLKL